MKDFGLYIVMSSPHLGYERFTEICVEEAVPMLQLREKHLPDAELLRLAKRLACITKGSATRFIINDRPDICLLSAADGIHLGPDDLPWQEARRILPPDSILGVSTHSLAQAEQLISSLKESSNPPSYMSFGPIYPTLAKAIPDPPLGTAQLKTILKAATLPLVAIGGIFPHKLSDVLASGARNICMIRHFGSSKDEIELRDKISYITKTIKDAS